MKKVCGGVLSFVLPVLLAAGSALAAPYGMFRVVRSADLQPEFAPASLSAAQAPQLVHYYGGPVISHAKVYAVFWGQGVDAKTRADIGPFYANILDSGYMDWLSEYGTDVQAMDGRAGTDQTIGRGRYAGAATISPQNKSQSLTDAMIRAELAAQIAAGHLPAPDADTLYMIYFPAGVSVLLPDGSQSCQDFEGYHEGFVSKGGSPVYYGVFPDCGTGFSDLGVTSSHETIEAVTDPFPTNGTHPAYPQAWNSATGDEISDLCDGVSTSYVTGASGLVSEVEPGWSDLANACNMGPWTAKGPAQRLALAPLRLKPAPLMTLLVRANSASIPWDGR
jgi:hypothetical protein